MGSTHCSKKTDPADQGLEDASDLLEQLATELRLPLREPGDFTATQLSKAAGVSERTAQRLLLQKVEQGLLESVTVKDGRSIVRVYRRKPCRKSSLVESHS